VDAAHDFSYTPNYDGSIASLSYPSGRVVNYGYDGAARPLSATGASNAYAQNALYYPPGQLSSLTEGASGNYSVGLTQTFNNRLQPINFTSGTYNNGALVATLMNLTYGFNLGNGDNGNVGSITSGGMKSPRSVVLMPDSALCHEPKLPLDVDLWISMPLQAA